MINALDTPKIKWLNPKKVLGSTIARMLPSSGEMLDAFVEHGLIENVTGNYSLDVYDMCRNGATWLGAHLAQIMPQVEVVEGTFMGYSHCWCVIEDLYLDMTIAQVNPEYPEFALVYSHKAEGYSEFLRFPILKWLERATKN